MPSRRLALLALLAAALAAPGVARAGIPVALYPVKVPGLSTAQRSDLHSLLAAGLQSASRRGILTPRSPLVLEPACGEIPAPACLAFQSAGGLVLVARGELRSGIVLLGATFYDRNGNHTREVRFVVDLVIQNLRPVGEALTELEVEIEPDGTVFGSKKAAPTAVDPGAKAPIVAGAPALAPAPQPAKPPPPAAKPAKAAPVDVSAPSRAVWKRQAGPVFTAIGAGLLVGGAAVALSNKMLSDDLDQKYQNGTLTPADKASYDRVQRKNVVTAVLLSAGGVSLAAGTYLWFTAPKRPGDLAMAGAGGRF